jgi:hypothetical protein
MVPSPITVHPPTAAQERPFSLLVVVLLLLSKKQPEEDDSSYTDYSNTTR